MLWPRKGSAPMQKALRNGGQLGDRCKVDFHLESGRSGVADCPLQPAQATYTSISRDPSQQFLKLCLASQ